MLFNRIRYFNKYILNRLMLRIAGSTQSKFAVVGHVGRRSGRSYKTPIIVAPRATDVVVALTYGPNVDWYRNLLAAEQGTLRWQGKTYPIMATTPLDRAAALSSFPALERFILRLLRIQHFVRMTLATPEAQRT